MPRSETGRPMGHEAIGVVEDVGAAVRNIKRGDLVVMPFAFSDGTCALPDGYRAMDDRESIKVMVTP